MASAMTSGLILLGNSGVGKSFLANRLLDDDHAFESRFSARSVTRRTEWKDMQTHIGKYIYRVANIPGLVEANQKLIDENRTEIMRAFEQCPFSVVIFVFGHKNGRIPDEDLVAFTQINDAYGFPFKSLLLIVNGIPSDRPDNYEEKTRELLQELTHLTENHIYFIEKVTSEDDKKNIHDLLYEAIAKCEPSYHEKRHDIELVADEISRLKKESQQRQDQLLAQKNEYLNKKESVDLGLDPTLELHQPTLSQTSSTRTNITNPYITDNNQQFNEIMKSMQADHDQAMEELRKTQHDPNRDAIKRLAQQLERNNEQNKRLVDEISSQPTVIIIPKERRKNKLLAAGKAVIETVVNTFSTASNELIGENQPQEPEHRRWSRQDRNQHHHQPCRPNYSNPHDQNDIK